MILWTHLTATPCCDVTTGLHWNSATMPLCLSEPSGHIKHEVPNRTLHPQLHGDIEGHWEGGLLEVQLMFGYPRYEAGV